MALTLLKTKIPSWLFTNETVEFVQQQILYILGNIYIDKDSVKRVLYRVLEERLEDKEKMIQRVIMHIVNEFRAFQREKINNFNKEFYFKETQRVFDPNSLYGPDMQMIKLSKQPSTMRFWFTKGLPITDS